MNAAVNVGVLLLVHVDDRLNDLSRPLRGGGVVEIDERHAGLRRQGERVGMDPRLQDRKVGAEGFGIEGLARVLVWRCSWLAANLSFGRGITFISVARTDRGVDRLLHDSPRQAGSISGDSA